MTFDDNNLARDLFGAGDSHLKVIEEKTGVDIAVRGTDVHLRGGREETILAKRILEELYALLRKGHLISQSDIEQSVKLVAANHHLTIQDFFEDRILVPSRKAVIAPRNLNQKDYIEKIRRHDMVFAIGPAGTGKTYMAVAMAVNALMRKYVARIVLTRPAVEAGERLGFLPGDMREKINPYLRPLYEALYDMMGYERVADLMDKGIIEVAPLAFMRGRTLSASFIILDEAQNTTSEQMKMFLTRLGFDSKAVITGDITQIDLPHHAASGLIEAQKILGGVPDIAFQIFTGEDVVRHHLVSDIIRAYEKRGRGESTA